MQTPITVAYGDGIGPEIMQATLDVLKAAGAKLEIETIEIGEAVYHRGISAGIEPSAWASLRRTKVFLKAPITTPQGGGFKSLNVTVRKTLGLYANIRPCVAYHPFVRTKHKNMDVVIVRENEEDLYAGIEHRQTHDVYQCLKLSSLPGCERIVRYAFEYARQNNRKKVTCFTKDNIMKMTDGLFHKVFDQVAKEYSEITSEHWIVDIGAAKLADTPEAFDVIVMPNLYGDILSSVAAQIAGSIGLAGSANIGDFGAMFEAVHGSAPRRAGQDLANPSGLLLAGVMMLNHIGQNQVAEKVHNAWLKTLEEGIHTYDIYEPNISKERVGTKAFTKAVIARLGQKPETLAALQYASLPGKVPYYYAYQPREKRELVGVDIFVCCPAEQKDRLFQLMSEMSSEALQLSLITSRGVKVWPEGLPETFCSDHWRCRFRATPNTSLQSNHILEILNKLEAAGIDWIKTEQLYTFDGEPGFSMGQGE